MLVILTTSIEDAFDVFLVLSSYSYFFCSKEDIFQVFIFFPEIEVSIAKHAAACVLWFQASYELLLSFFGAVVVGTECSVILQ